MQLRGVAIGAFVSSVIAVACSAGFAFGADLPSNKTPPAPPPLPAFTWTGFYVGFNFGYAFRESGAIEAASANLFDATSLWGAPSAAGASGLVDARLDGFVSGGQAGYNWQFTDAFVVGVEADISGAGVRGGRGFSAVTPAAPGAFVVTGAALKRRLEYLGTVRGRLGYAAAPNLLVYATGGLAYGGANVGGTIGQDLAPSLLVGKDVSGGFFENRVGWTAGAGVEWAFARNLSAKLEYLYYDLGSVSADGRALGLLTFSNLAGSPLFANATRVSTRFEGHVVRAGLNYRFDWSIPPTSGSAATPAFASPAFVADDRPALGEWRFSFTPYNWAIAVNGRSTTRGRTVGTDASFIDSFTETSAFPLAFMGRFEARNGPVSFYADIAWARLRYSGSSLTLRSPIADASLALNASGRLRQTMAIGEAGAAYELARWKLVGSGESFTALDASAGLRYWYIGLDLSLDVVGAINSELLGLSRVGAKAIAKSDNMQWIDPVVGLRVRHQVAPGREFQLRGDIGGFGVGSKFSWQAYGGYSHDFTFEGMNLSGLIGYRAVSVDYSQGAGSRQDGMNAIIHGPVTGLSLRF